MSAPTTYASCTCKTVTALGNGQCRECGLWWRIPTQSDTWQPIATAPRDGTRVLVFFPSGNSAAAYYQYGDDEDMAGWWGDGGFQYTDPTHWQPLPAPPAAADTTEGER